MRNTKIWPRTQDKPTPGKLAFRIVLLALAYILIGEISLSLSANYGIVTLVAFMAEGVALAATILWGKRVWPGIFIGQTSLALLHGLPWLAVLGFSATNSITAVLGALLFDRLGMHRSYDRIRDVVSLLLLSACVLQPISATFGTLSLLAAGAIENPQFIASWTTVWLGNLIGQMVMTPLLLSWHSALTEARTQWRRQLQQNGFALLLMLVISFALLAVPQFRGIAVGVAALPPLMVLLAAHYGMRVTTAATTLFILTNLLFAYFGIHLFSGTTEIGYVELDLFLLSIVLVGQFVAALFAEREQADQQRALNHARLNDAQRIANVGSWELDLVSGRLAWSDEIYRIFEIDRATFDASYRAFLEQVHPEDRVIVDQTYRNSLVSKQPYQLIHRLRLANGRIKYVQESCETQYAENGRPLRSCGTVLDISVLKQAEEQLQLYARVFEQSTEAIIITDGDNNIQQVNPAFTEVTGYTLDEVRGRNPRLLASGRTSRETYPSLWQALLTNGVWQGELWDRRKDGSVFPKWATISLIRDSQGRITHHMASFTDITERKRAEEHMHRLAHHDALTGLSNRLGLKNRLEQALLTSHRERRQLAAIFIDMDRFKHINDSLGHHTGDLLLIEVAQRLQASARASDIIVRLGGDEFVVILDGNINQTTAAQIATKITQRLAEPYLLEGHTVDSSPSMGLALYPEHATTAASLLRCADQAMYAAKHAGRNCWRIYDPSMA